MKQTEYLNLKQKIKKINDPLVSRTFLDILERVRNLEDEIKKIQDSKPEKIPVEKNEIKSCLNCQNVSRSLTDYDELWFQCPYTGGLKLPRPTQNNVLISVDILNQKNKWKKRRE